MFFVKASLQCSQRSHFPSLKPHANPTLVALSQYILNSWTNQTNQRLIFTSVLLHERHGETDDTGSEADSSSPGTNAKPYDVIFNEAVGLVETSEPVEGIGGGEVGKKLWELEMELKELMANSDGNNGKLEWRSRKWWRKKEMETTERSTEDGEEGVVKGVKGNKFSSGDSVVKSQSRLNQKVEVTGVEDSGKSQTTTSLSALFARKRRVREDSVLVGEQQGAKKGLVLEKDRIVREREDLIVKELSPDMQVFVRHLYDEGYFKDANFLPQNRFDVSCFESHFALDFLKFAVERYGRDKQEIAKWLSGSDLKQIALFGCPSLSKRTVFAAKSLRTFFQIPEDTVCRKCVLRESCKFVNQSVWNKNTKQLKLQPIMRLLTVYALQAVPAELVLSDDIKDCVSRLMKNVMNLGKTVPRCEASSLTRNHMPPMVAQATRGQRKINQ